MKEMKHILMVLSLFFVAFQVKAQEIQTLVYGKNTLIGKVILKDLKHPKTGKTIKNALVFKLPKKVQFKAKSPDESDTVTDEIRIYGDVNTVKNPSQTYKALINKKVEISANFVFAPSYYYPLLVNIIDDFEYKIVTK
jgi:hypothetical protein